MPSNDDAILEAIIRETGKKPRDVGHDGSGNIILLDYRNSRLTSLSGNIAKLVNLRLVDLRSNYLSQLPSDFAKLANLQYLNLGYNQLTQLPDDFAKLVELLSLNLDHNQLTQLPSHFAKLANLRFLDLGSNQLTQFPSDITKLVSLQYLGSGSNQLAQLPSDIAKLVNLQSLDLSSNQLTQLPSNIARLVKLRHLYLNSNRLTQLPDDITKLVNLMTLDISANQLTQFPSDIAKLVKLRYLYLRSNRLTQLPSDFAKLAKLRELRLEDNPCLLFPPPEVVKKGQEAILEYLRDLDQQGEVEQYRAKLIFVGEGGVGKTCTLRALKGERINKKEKTTRGIDVGVLRVTHATKKDVKLTLNSWDFGGQQIYHATHQFFMTKRSLYLLVWNARTGSEACKVDYWLRLIHSRAKDAPIILVATHIDERPPDINYQRLKDKYPQLVGACAISTTENTNIDELREKIKEIASDRRWMPQMGEPWPRRWFDVAATLRKEKCDRITRADFETICGKNDVVGDSVWTLASWLHDLGDILFFHDDSGLDDLVVLKPEWITKAISLVLEHEDTRKALGVLDHKKLSKIWHDYQRDLHPAFLRLAEKFDLCYRMADEPNKSVVAELLPFEPPKIEWPEAANLPTFEKQLGMCYDLDTLPPGIMTWFIVRSHRFTADRHWREGVYLEYQEHRALAELDPASARVKLRVQGAVPQHFFSVLTDSMDVILSRFEGLTIHRSIPCICHELRHVAQRCEYLFSYENLLKRLKDGKDDAECQSSYTDVPLSRLLFGLHPAFNDQLLKEIKELKDQQSIQFRQMSELVMRNFLRLHNLELAKLEADCPAVFTILSTEKKGLGRLNFMTDKLDLMLWCQMPGCEHPIEKSTYPIEQPKEWLAKVQPWMATVFDVLKFAIPASAAVTNMIASDEVWKRAKDSFDIMGKLVKEVPVRKVEEWTFDGELVPQEFVNSEGADRRIVYEFLKAIKAYPKYAGLRKTITTAGDILWLCPIHYKIFDPGLPVLPK